MSEIPISFPRFSFSGFGEFQENKHSHTRQSVSQAFSKDCWMASCCCLTKPCHFASQKPWPDIACLIEGQSWWICLSSLGYNVFLMSIIPWEDELLTWLIPGISELFFVGDLSTDDELVRCSFQKHNLLVQKLFSKKLCLKVRVFHIAPTKKTWE